jgi:RNA polymerase sigma factor (sigma-70 family)
MAVTAAVKVMPTAIGGKDPDEGRLVLRRPGSEVSGLGRIPDRNPSFPAKRALAEAAVLAFLKRALLRARIDIPKDCEIPQGLTETIKGERARELREISKQLGAGEFCFLDRVLSALDWCRAPRRLFLVPLSFCKLRETLDGVAAALIAPPGKPSVIRHRELIEAWSREIPAGVSRREVKATQMKKGSSGKVAGGKVKKRVMVCSEAFRGCDKFEDYLERRGILAPASGGPTIDHAIESRIKAAVPGSDSCRLSAGEEPIIFAKLQFLFYRFHALVDPVLAGRPKRGVFSEAAGIYHKAKDLQGLLAKCNKGLVLSIIGERMYAAYERDGLESDADAALARAVDAFNPWTTFKFSTFACRIIMRSLLRFMEVEDRHHRRYMGVNSSDLDAANVARTDSEAHDGAHAELEENRHMMQKAMLRADLTDSELTVIYLRFGLRMPDKLGLYGELDSRINAHFAALGKERPAELTLDVSGRMCGVTRERIRQVQNGAIAKLKDSLQELL